MVPCIVLLFATLVVHTATLSTLQKVQQKIARGQQWPEAIAFPSLRPGVVDQRVEQASWTHALRVPIKSVDSEPQCSKEETQLLAPVDELTKNILGKTTTNETVLPSLQPIECMWARQIANYYALEGCYAAMGFAFGVAKCWATEEVTVEINCALVCPGWSNSSMKTIECQKCLSFHRLNRMKCTYKYMGIREKCQQCQIEAREFGDHNCVMQCVDDTGINCKQCNDQVEEMRSECLV